MTQKMKILIGYDGSDCAEAALDDLQRAGLPPVAEALVMSVTEIWLPPPPLSSYEVFERARQVHVPADLKRVYSKGSAATGDAQSLAERAAVRLRANFPGWEMAAAASVGSSSRDLIMTADRWQPDLIVVGSHGRSKLGRLVLGSVSQGVLTHARCSVRVARGRVEEPDTPVRIVVGVDGSPASRAAVGEVKSRVWPLKSEVRVIAVNDPLTPTFVGQFIPPVAKTIEESNRADREWLKKCLESSSQQLRRSELKVVTEIREGDPKRVLVEAAEGWGADCIFVGSIGFGNPFERFVLGSVSAGIAARAHCSVEVVRQRKTNGGSNHERQSKYSSN
ncbi:MAG: universal stress protein [Pyrinomonadaceae bacterium]|nr:universal stress protein [Pyrinomonadaceae bacterium]